MKKQAYILLTTMITLSTACMEKERKKTEPLNIQSSSIVRPANSSLYSMSTLNGLLQPQPLLTTHVTRRQFSDVGFDYVPMYVPNNTNEASTTDDIPLTPLYRPISPTEYLDCRTNTQKTVPFFQEKQNTQHAYLVNRLYNSARDLVNFRTFQHNNMTDDDRIFTQNQKCVTLVELMIAAKKKGITEDFMGNLSYTKWNDPTISFIFGCLKKYMLTVANTGEKLPFNSEQFYTHDNRIQTLKATNKERITVEQIKTLSPKCPVFHTDLWKSINNMVENGLTWCVPYVYASTYILSKEYPQYSHITDIDECLDTFELIWRSKDCYTEKVYRALNLIEQIKKITGITQEKNLGYIYFLNPEKKEALKEKILRWPSKTTYEYNQKFKALFCVLVEKYHENRGNKITPKPLQHYIHNALEHIALPDSFDLSLLDENYYALKELTQLIVDTTILRKKSKEEDIQSLIDQHYIFNE